jgi:spore coat polysaccharide biosynthesis protein SpsF
MTRIFIQARMSSRRFPGKVLTPLSGRPVLQRLVDAVTEIVPRAEVAILTSTDPSDTAIEAFAAPLGVAVVRGPLDDVFERFRVALAQLPCDRFVRLSADSPVLPAMLLDRMLSVPADGADIVTNVFPRTFPKGWSVEVVNAATFAAIEPRLLSPHDREHVTPYFYASPGRFTIRNVASANPRDADLSLAVDSPEDLARIETIVQRGALPPVTFA